MPPTPLSNGPSVNKVLSFCFNHFPLLVTFFWFIIINFVFVCYFLNFVFFCGIVHLSEILSWSYRETIIKQTCIVFIWRRLRFFVYVT